MVEPQESGGSTQLLQDPFTPDERDLELIHALQISPRASWRALGDTLGVDPVTLARRWDRLRACGLARITAVAQAGARPDQCMAHLELSCELGAAGAVAQHLARDREAITVQHTAGMYNVVATIKAESLLDLNDYLLTRVGRIEGVAFSRTQVQTDMYLDGSTWKLDTLDSRQQHQLVRSAAPPPRRGGRQRGGLDDALYLQLVEDGRRSYADLARDLGIGVSAARRRVDAMLADRAVVLRCDIARRLFGWNVCVDLQAICRSDPQLVVRELRAKVPEIRVLAGVAGQRNLKMYVWLRRLSDLQATERRLREVVPDVEIEERIVVLETVKQAGHLLDRDGRSVATIPPIL